jgi:hypothetical protein
MYSMGMYQKINDLFYANMQHRNNSAYNLQIWYVAGSGLTAQSYTINHVILLDYH